jgi:hypothetical protein
VEAVEQRPQLLGRDVAGEAERPCPGTPPPSRRLVRVEVVVDRTTARTTATLPILGQAGVVAEQLPEPVVRGLQRRAPHHRDVPARPNALVCALTTSDAGGERESRGIGTRFDSRLAIPSLAVSTDRSLAPALART